MLQTAIQKLESGDAPWWDFNIETYNPFDYDVGCSMSYLKI